MNPPRIAVCVLAREGPERLEQTVGAVLPQARDGDAVLIALSEMTPGRDECAEVVVEARSAWRPEVNVLLLDHHRVTARAARPRLGFGNRMTAFNAALLEAKQDVVAFVDDRTGPLPGWLAGVRACMEDPGIDLVAGRILGAAPPEAGRPGGRLRWTGHVQADYAGEVAGSTSLAHPANFAVRRLRAVRLRGFDESFADEAHRMPFAEVEFFTRLGKEGGRGRYCPEAAVDWRSPIDPYEAEMEEGLPDDIASRTAAMAAVFARHEAWALLIMGASHLLGALPEVVAGRLPRSTPGRLVRAFLDGIRLGVRPVHSPIPHGKGSKR